MIKGFWISKSRTTLRKIFSDCVICKTFNTFAFQYPRFPNYTKAQGKLFLPYKHVGVDITKHWWVKVKGSSQVQIRFVNKHTCYISRSNTRYIFWNYLPIISEIYLQIWSSRLRPQWLCSLPLYKEWTHSSYSLFQRKGASSLKGTK